MSYSRTICGDIKYEGPKLAKGTVRYDRIISNTPIIPGRWPGVADESELTKAIYATMDMAQNVLHPNGTITTNVGRGPAFHGQKQLKKWQELNDERINGLEEIPNSAFRVWYGTWIDLHTNDVFVHGRPENHHFKTFRRKGSDATINEYELPDNIGRIDINNVTKCRGLYPIDHSPVPNEGEMWLFDRGYNPIVWGYQASEESYNANVAISANSDYIVVGSDELYLFEKDEVIKRINSLIEFLHKDS